MGLDDVDGVDRARQFSEEAKGLVDQLCLSLSGDGIEELTTVAGTQLAAALEIARRLRRTADDLCYHLAEAAMQRGLGPRTLNWNDGRSD